MNIINAKKELLSFLVGKPKIKCFTIDCDAIGKDVFVELNVDHTDDELREAINSLNFNYKTVDFETGIAQRLYGRIWFEDNTWASRRHYDDSEWWHHNVLPEIPAFLQPVQKDQTTLPRTTPNKTMFETESYEDYTTFVISTALVTEDSQKDKLVFLTGLFGESGEVAEKIKKNITHNHPRFTNEDIAKELGDVVWYTVMLAVMHGYTLDEIINLNIEKLQARMEQKTLFEVDRPSENDV